MRRHVLNEICVTEARYLEAMRDLNRLFVVPMSSFIELDELQEKLFPWIDEILVLHEEFSGMTQMTVAGDLVRLVHKMEPVYCAHIVRLRRALELLAVLQKTEQKAGKLIENAQIGHARGMELLNMLMIAPTQRLARYPLLLREG